MADDKKFEHKSVWLGLSIGGALAIVIGMLWFVFSVVEVFMEQGMQPWLAAVVIMVLGTVSVIIGDTVLMKQELK